MPLPTITMRQSPKIDRLSGLAGVWLSAALLMASADATAAQTGGLPTPQAVSLKIGKQPGAEFTLDARQAPLAQVLQTIVDKTGTKIHYTALPEAPVTANCVGANVRQIMECLIGQQLGLVARSPETGGAVEFWLLGACSGHCQEVVLKAANAAQNATNADHERSDELLENYKNAKTLDDRRNALGYLTSGANINDPQVRHALEDAMKDKNPGIRAQALASLATMDKDNATTVLGAALRDRDPGIRIAAIENAYDNREVLEQAANDPDNSIRTYAASKLAALNKQLEKAGQ